MQTPLEKYKQDLQDDNFSPDPAQKKAVLLMQRLFEELTSGQTRSPSLVAKLSGLLGKNHQQNIKGLYFWGGVGRGKTYLVDCFFDCLPIKEKMRIHFHRFMQNVHRELKQLNHVESPLQLVADKLAQQTRVLCFDEFHVSDITDAMLLGGLLQALFDRGVVLVTTSNQPPDELYKGGLQRERFLPAIALLKQHTRVMNLDSGIDYRLRFLDQAEIYHTPLDADGDRMLAENFSHMSPDAGQANMLIEIEGRDIQTVQCGDGVAWFDFKALCDGPRGPADYIEIARQFQTVLLANIPVMSDMENDMAKRFITLVDEFYDRHVKLIATAAAEPTALYNGNRLAHEFERTVSRLQEMRTHDYLAREHLP
ncbi:MAG: cell division protein ZapE [Gammaproteobacteria bacterium]